MLSVDNTVHRQHTYKPSLHIFFCLFFLPVGEPALVAFGKVVAAGGRTQPAIVYDILTERCSVYWKVYTGGTELRWREKKRKMKRLEYGWGGDHSNGKCNNKNLTGGGWEKNAHPNFVCPMTNVSSGWNSWFSNATVFTFHCSFPVVSSWKKPNTNRYK